MTPDKSRVQQAVIVDENQVIRVGRGDRLVQGGAFAKAVVFMAGMTDIDTGASRPDPLDHVPSTMIRSIVSDAYAVGLSDLTDRRGQAKVKVCRLVIRRDDQFRAHCSLDVVVQPVLAARWGDPLRSTGLGHS
jgi:hypothetical protein